MRKYIKNSKTYNTVAIHTDWIKKSEVTHVFQLRISTFRTPILHKTVPTPTDPIDFLVLLLGKRSGKNFPPKR